MTLRLPIWRRHARQARQATPDQRDRLVQYNTTDARNYLSDLLRRARVGEEIVIAHAGQPVAKLVPYKGREPTRPGVLRAHVVVHDGIAEQPEQTYLRLFPLDGGPPP